MALLSYGGYADYVAVPEGQVMPVPDAIDQAHAAAIPESLATAWSNLVDVLRVGDGTTVLIQGGSGSLGTIAVQLARELGPLGQLDSRFGYLNHGRTRSNTRPRNQKLSTPAHRA